MRFAPAPQPPLVVDQLPRLVGAHLEKTGFLRDTFAILAHLPQTSHVTLAVSAAIVVLIFLVPRVPAPLFAVAAVTRARGPCCSTDPHRQLGGGLVSIPQDYLDRPVAVIGAGTLGRRIALMFATGWILAAETPGWRHVLLTVAAAVLVWRTRLHVLVMIAAGAIVGGSDGCKEQG